jgi:hypothetical protein
VRSVCVWGGGGGGCTVWRPHTWQLLRHAARVCAPGWCLNYQQRRRRASQTCASFVLRRREARVTDAGRRPCPYTCLSQRNVLLTTCALCAPRLLSHHRHRCWPASRAPLEHTMRSGQFRCEDVLPADAGQTNNRHECCTAVMVLLPIARVRACVRTVWQQWGSPQKEPHTASLCARTHSMSPPPPSKKTRARARLLCNRPGQRSHTCVAHAHHAHTRPCPSLAVDFPR